MRRVQISYGQSFYQAYFHHWTDTSSEQYMQALIELDDGQVMLVPFYAIKFLDKPKEEK